jgi:DNA mismatch repair ATPase MutS
LLVDWLDSRRNQFFALLAILLSWGTQFAFALEKWRRRNGPAVAHWCEAVGELEALASLGAYTYENPRDVLPELLDGEPCLAGEQVGHPLLAGAVANDFTLGDARRLYLISGSNMSGKSTFLRSVGANVVLAQLGAPVRAKTFRLSPLAVGATLRVQDNLREGASRFYAEVVRLRQIVDLTKQPRAVLFLLDEILAGTNSHDRLAGATAILRGLLAKRAIGAVTTHDLALTQVASELGARVENVYFADHFENGKMHFDYRMRTGVITKSNALELMRSVGLDV